MKDLEVKLKEEETAAEEDWKKKPGVKDTAEVTRLKKDLKTKKEELDKFKTQAKKVSAVNIIHYSSGMDRTVQRFLETACPLPRLLSHHSLAML